MPRRPLTPPSYLPLSMFSDLFHTPEEVIAPTDPDERHNTLPSQVPAARAVFLVAELRQAILALLPRADLVRLMRVCRMSMPDVARVLYHTVPYQLVHDLSRHLPRHAIYLASITIISPRPRQFPSTTQAEQYIYHLPGLHNTLSSYSPEHFLNLFIPNLRAKCPSLRTVLFGPDRPGWETAEHPSWQVRFDPYMCVGGHIDTVELYELDMSRSPPTYLNLPPPPHIEYIVRYHFNFRFIPTCRLGIAEGYAIHPDIVRQWLHAIEHSPIFNYTYHSLDFADFPVTMDLLTSLYLRQLAIGCDHDERLDRITAYHIVPWSIDSFERFSSVASVCLTTLRLVEMFEYEYEDALATYADLPSIISLVRNNLPNLQTFHFILSGALTAEEECRGMLRPNGLEEGGTISDLLIAGDGYDSVLFNVVRMVSQMCTSDALLSINEACDAWELSPYWDSEDTTDFFRYLRRQPPQARAHLAVVDFDTLRLSYPYECHNLQYDWDGRPLPLEDEIKDPRDMESEEEDDEWDDCPEGMRMAGNIGIAGGGGAGRMAGGVRLVWRDDDSGSGTEETAESKEEEGKGGTDDSGDTTDSDEEEEGW